MIAMGMKPSDMAAAIKRGLLSFPVTHFDTDDRFDAAAYRKHCAWLLEHEAAALFAAGGTGEFFSLRPDEIGEVVSTAVAETKGKVPVIAGCGYGTALAVQLARDAEKRGADGILLLPPYLVSSEQQGLAIHIEQVCKAVSIGVIVYNRDNAIANEDTMAKLCERNANLVGFKDGVGDIELLTRIRLRLGDRVTYIGGMPTAETYALPYKEIGIDTYSSAIFNFMPVWAKRFHAAVLASDRATVRHHLRDFVLPYIAIRGRAKGYAVSIVKAGLRIVGRPAGHVRTPLMDLKPAELEELRALIERAQKLN
jgi:5-dehydro-4-deoxyglucarate dehydratase